MKSEPVFVTWSLLVHLKGLWLWLPLILAITLVRANRSLMVLWLVIPLLLTKLGLVVLAQATEMPADISGMLEYVAFGPLVMGLSVVLLMGEILGRYQKKRVAWGLALLIFVSANIMGVLAYGYSQELLQGLVITVIMDSTVLLAMALTTWRCRKRYVRWRFFLWLALWTILCCLVAMSIFLVVMVILNAMNAPAGEILRVLLVSLVFGGVLYGIQLPFVLLGMLNRFYQPRFLTVLGLDPPADSSQTQQTDGETDKQEKTQDTGQPKID